MSISLTPVQQATGTGASGTSFTVTLGSAPVQGNDLVCCFGGNPAGATINNISHTGVVWTKAVGSAPQGRDYEQWLGIVGAGAGTVATINTNGTITDTQANISEWSGVDTSATDATNENDQAATAAPASGALAATVGREDLIICGYRVATGRALSSGPTNRFVPLTTPSATLFQCAYLVTDVAGSYSTQWNLAGSTAWVCWTVAYKANRVTLDPGTFKKTMMNGMALDCSLRAGRWPRST